VSDDSNRDEDLAWAAQVFERYGVFAPDGSFAKIVADENTVRRFQEIIGVGEIGPIGKDDDLGGD
jgi:hypothetical protein